jgi:hypothetical protein
MNENITSILALINAAIKIGGDIVPIALRAYAALKNETGMTDAELTAAARELNAADAAKLEALIAETEA